MIDQNCSVSAVLLREKQASFNKKMQIDSVIQLQESLPLIYLPLVSKWAFKYLDPP